MIRSCLLMGWVVLVLPWVGMVLTNLLADSSLANLVWFAAAMLAIVLSLAVAQGMGLLLSIARTVRGLFGGQADAPLSTLAKLGMASGPFWTCVLLFGGLGGLLWLVGSIPVLLAAVWLGLGGVYGISLAIAVLTGAIDPQDADALGIYPEVHEEAQDRKPRRKMPEG